MRTRELATEMREAFAALRREYANILANLDISPFLIWNWQLIGKASVRSIGNDLYEPDPNGVAALVTPVLAHYCDTPELPDPEFAVRCGNIVDLIAWRPKCPARWRLRVGAATWAGSIPPQYCNPDPVRIWRTPLRWLQADCTGLVLLTGERIENYRQLSNCRGGIDAEDEIHAREIRRILNRPWPGPEVRHAA